MDLLNALVHQKAVTGKSSGIKNEQSPQNSLLVDLLAHTDFMEKQEPVSNVITPLVINIM